MAKIIRNLTIFTEENPGENPTSYPGYFRYAREKTLVGAADDLLTWPKQNKIGWEGKVFCVHLLPLRTIFVFVRKTKITSV